MATPILDAVRVGQLSPTNALLINRSPVDYHSELIEYGQSATKKQLMQKISTLKESGAPVSNNAGIIEKKDLRTQIHERYQLIRRKTVWKRIEKDPQLKAKIEHVDSLLAELLNAAQTQ